MSSATSGAPAQCPYAAVPLRETTAGRTAPLRETPAHRTAPLRETTPNGTAPLVLYASVLTTLLAASSAPTPLYPLYQDQWGLSALTVTVIFSAYSLTLLLALLTVGALSDHLGRRPVLVGALVLAAASMVLLATADGAGPLIAARVLQGAATGAATSASGAALLDLDDPLRPGRSALTNSITPVAGMAGGVLVSTLLIPLSPAPTVTVYLLLAALFAAQAATVTLTAETGRRRPGALRSLLPRLGVPPSARRALLTVGTGVVAVWALGGLYSSLGPALVRLVAPGTPRTAGGMVFFTVSAAAALTVWTLRRTAPATAATGGCLAVIPSAALSLGALHGAGPLALFGGAALAGIAFGAVSQGALRMMLNSLDERDRATTVAAYYVLSYLAMSLPAIAAGAATQHYGLRTAAYAYAIGAAVLAAAAVAALTASRRHALPR
ncbi:MFS transporter [Streptomyces sp. PSAA01]|uniref:MFS transporter n=1 Tax=Streptomyces sp. PSAA01 TaxID=2912762 RepID=UPI001EFFE609|nr:MFS transporter [Streptomyces sp. PSAA01]MCG0283551.1 MFS transporter [Streptomyces sp. PSAA01]